MGKTRRYVEVKEDIRYVLEYRKKKHKDYVEYLRVGRIVPTWNGGERGLILKINYNPSRARIKILSYSADPLGEERVLVPIYEVVAEIHLINPSDRIRLGLDFYDLRRSIRRSGTRETIKSIMRSILSEIDLLKIYTDKITDLSLLL